MIDVSLIEKETLPAKSPACEVLLEKIGKKQTRVGVIGMGYVGTPLALAFAAQGFKVIGFDVDSARVGRIMSGESCIKTIPDEAIRKAREAGTLEATSSAVRLTEADCVIICVPTPLTMEKTPDLSYVENASRDILATLRLGQLVILESTTYPGTTVEIVKPILESKGLKAGADFFLAYSPEREDPGVKGHTITQIPKVVGGCDSDSLSVAKALYGHVAKEVVAVSSTQVAEATKMLENIYRAVNIALVNELKMLFDVMGIDVWEVIKASSTKPFGYHAFYPGPGWGGHCIPIDPYYLSWKAKRYNFTTRFIELAGEINTRMTEYVINKTVAALNNEGKAVKGSKILILGVAYKADVDDMRESPAIPIYQELVNRGAIVTYHDPYVPAFDYRHGDVLVSGVSEPWSAELLSRSDCVLVLTAHKFYDPEFIVANAGLVVDTRRLVARDLLTVVRA